MKRESRFSLRAFFILDALLIVASYGPALFWVPRLAPNITLVEKVRVFLISPVAFWQSSIHDQVEYGSVFVFGIVILSCCAAFCKYRWAMIVLPLVFFIYCLAQGLFVAGFYGG